MNASEIVCVTVYALFCVLMQIFSSDDEDERGENRG